MPSAATLFRFSATVIPCHQRRCLPPTDLHLPFSEIWSIAGRDKRTNFNLLAGSRCDVIFKTRRQVYRDVYQSGQTRVERQETFLGEEEAASMVYFANEREEKIQSIKMMLGSMEDGEISISAYDTAWVALVEDINGSGVPQFPSSLQWIVQNQLPDGSWGMVFIRENMSKLESENEEHMPIGFEVAFPSLMEIAEREDLQVPTDIPVIHEIYAKRNLKLTRIPKDMMHVVPTTLLHSLEGMDGLDWEKLLKLQCEDGSFLFSPSSTAFALMQTKDERCLKYIKKAVETFNGGVPNVYPVDLFEHIWAVDRLERLGISRYFKSEIKECLNYVFRYWSEDGICWARNSRVHDIDDTAMGFRLLRLHGHEVSPDAFRHFEKGGEFFCFAGQSNQAITGIFNLYRASHVLFPGESILEEAKAFASRFLREKQASNQLLDKWIITKDLPGEVGYALDFPWYASLARVEARFYIEQYGGDDDVWIGKTLYRMPYVNNDEYLELAKSDFNNCQALHQLEWTTIQKWYSECNLDEFGVGRRVLLQAYFVAMASIFEPDRARERLAWAKAAVLLEAVKSYMEMDTTTVDQRREFVNDFNNTIHSCSSTSDIHHNNGIGLWVTGKPSEWKTTGKKLLEALLTTLNSIAVESLVIHRLDLRHHLLCTWNTWLLLWCPDRVVEKEQQIIESTNGRGVPVLGNRRGEEGEGELLVRIINLCAGRPISEEHSFNPHYQRLLHLTNSICHHLRLLLSSRGHWKKKNNLGTNQIDPLMQELVQLVLRNSDGIDPDVKKTFLIVAKSFYYAAHCNPSTINHHIAKVLFQSVA